MGRKKLNFERTLVLRIYDERLQARIREKMAAVEDESNKETASKLNQQQQQSRGLSQHHFAQHRLGSSNSNSGGAGTGGTASSQESKLFDLPGVNIEPAIQYGNSGLTSTNDPTLWKFICDGATYPARLTNLPCPVELHKTHDHAMYYKCIDVGQMLIVYEDMTALEEAESMPGFKIDGFPGYYHSGLTPPTSRIVRKRFKERFESRVMGGMMSAGTSSSGSSSSSSTHNRHRPQHPTYEEVQQVEQEIKKLMDSISSKDAAGKTKKNPKPVLNKVLEEVDDVVVQYEPWMDDYGRQPDGIEFDETDDIVRAHPELWLHPSEIKDDSVTTTLDSRAGRSTTGAKSKTPISMISSPNSRKEKNLTPDAPSMMTGIGSTMTTTKTKKKKTTTTKKKKSKTQKKSKSSGDTKIQRQQQLEIQKSETPIPDPSNTALDDLDAIPLEMNALDDLDMDNLGLDGLDGLDGLGDDVLMDDDLLLM